MSAADQNQKKKFAWQAGETIDHEVYEPLGKVRDHGIIHLGEALPADEKLRQEQLEEKLQSQKDVVYSTIVTKRAAPLNPDEILIEESGEAQGDIDEEKARKLLDREPRKIRGSGIFGKK